MDLRRERRQFARAKMKWPATIITSSAQLIGETKDISQVGVCISCRELLPVGQEFRLEIQPPNRQPIIVTAKAVWAMETGSLEFSRRFVVGAEFEYISENDIRFLDDIIANRIQTTN